MMKPEPSTEVRISLKNQLRGVPLIYLDHDLTCVCVCVRTGARITKMMTTSDKNLRALSKLLYLLLNITFSSFIRIKGYIIYDA